MLASVYSYHVMVKSVSSCCVRGRRVLSNPVTNYVYKPLCVVCVVPQYNTMSITYVYDIILSAVFYNS